MNIFWREMKANRTSFILWCIGVLFMVGTGMMKFTSLSSTGISLNDFIADMPKSLQAIMGNNSLDLSSAIGYYGVLYLYLVVMAAIHASMLGANIISKEEREKTVEFLLVKPISRSQMITSKFVAAFIQIVLLNLVTLVFSILIVQAYAEGEEVIGDITIMMLGMFILQLIFLDIGTAIAAIVKKSKTATSLSTGILLITFILAVAINMNSKLEYLKYFTPFKYFEANRLMSDGFEALYIILSIGLITVLTQTVTPYIFYQKTGFKYINRVTVTYSDVDNLCII